MLKRGVPADSGLDTRATKRWQQRDVHLSRHRANSTARDIIDLCFDEDFGTDGHDVGQSHRQLSCGIPPLAYGRQHTESQTKVLSQTTTGSIVHRSSAQRNTSDSPKTTMKQAAGSVREASDLRQQRYIDTSMAHHNQAPEFSARGHLDDAVVLRQSRYAIHGHSGSMHSLIASDDKKDAGKPPRTHARMPFVDDDSDPDDLLGLDASADEDTHPSIRQGAYATTHQQANAASKHRVVVNVQNTLGSAQHTQSKQQLASGNFAKTPVQNFRVQTPINKSLVQIPPAKQPVLQRSAETKPSVPTSHITKPATKLPPNRSKQQNKAVITKNVATATSADTKSREVDTAHMSHGTLKKANPSNTHHKPDKQAPQRHQSATSPTQRSSNPPHQNNTTATLPPTRVQTVATISRDAKQINPASPFQNIVAQLQAKSRDAVLDKKPTMTAPAALASCPTQTIEGLQKPIDNDIKITSTRPARDDNVTAVQTLRQCRIEDKKERNRRNREEVPIPEAQIVDALDARQRHISQAPRNPTTIGPSPKQTLPLSTSPSRKPFALNSAAGLTAIRLSCEQSAVSITKDDRPHSRKLGRVTARDLVVRNMKNNGMVWRDIATMYELQTGVKRSPDTYRKRVYQVTKAIQMAGITEDLIDAVLREDQGAEDELNDLLTECLSDAAVRTEFDTEGYVREDGPAEVSPVTNLRTIEHDTLPEASSEQSERRTTGGKRPTWEYLQACWNATVEQSDVQSITSRESSADPEGYIHFEYQVQRRECSSKQETDDGMDIDDAQWFEVDEPHTSLIKANASASGPVLLMRFGDDPIVDGEHSFELKHNKDEDGAAQCEYTSTNGTVQTRVLQRLRTFRDRIPACSKAGWLPRTLYHIKQRITKRQEDDMFNEGPIIDVRETFIDGCTSADARWANSKAIERYVDLTYEAKSANLNLRDIEMAELRSVLSAGMEDSNLFQASKEISKVLVEVWVEQGNLVGPRNL